MTINKKSEGEKLTLTLSGRLDTNTSPALEAELKHSVDGVKELILIFPTWNIFPLRDSASCLRHRRS